MFAIRRFDCGGSPPPAAIPSTTQSSSNRWTQWNAQTLGTVLLSISASRPTHYYRELGKSLCSLDYCNGFPRGFLEYCARSEDYWGQPP